jgi:hypothetical protein
VCDEREDKEQVDQTKFTKLPDQRRRFVDFLMYVLTYQSSGILEQQEWCVGRYS